MLFKPVGSKTVRARLRHKSMWLFWQQAQDLRADRAVKLEKKKKVLWNEA